MANANSLVHDPVMTLMGPNGLRTAIISRHARRERSERVMATIVILGEESTNLRLVTLLGDHGHRVLEAADSEQALAIVRAEKPDLVLADILIGNMDGCQLVQSLRAEAGWARPRLIFLAAAYMETEARALARACGVLELIVKPAEPEALLARINAALSGPPPQTGKPSLEPAVAETYLRSMAGKLYQRVAELEQLNAQLDQRAAERTDQLEVARSGLEQEVTKRLWAERELTQANLRLHDRAVRDALTGLYNRGYLEESLDREESRARRSSQSLGVMMIDIDHFKRCNDMFGHAAGDTVLRAVAQHMLSLARGEDILCRYGGEEFALVMAHASPATMLERAEKICLGVQNLEIESDGRRVGPITLSAGIAIFPDHGESGQAVLQAADAALYRAKAAGRNCVVMANEVTPMTGDGAVPPGGHRTA
jgi:diguanylate cyclase (GGDEF)-like protein